MDIQFKGSNLLILRGVFPNDFTLTNSIFDAPRVQYLPEQPESYNDLPRQFTSVENWPKFSTLKCWECDQIPMSYPKFIPINPSKDAENRDICDVFGHFCEWNCAVSFVMKELPPDQRWDTLRYLCLFESKFTGRRREKIPPCPPKFLMKAYCGSSGITPKEWRDRLQSLNNEYYVSVYKIDQLREI